MANLPPYPSGNWFDWASQLVEWLISRETIEQETTPLPVQLPHKLTNEKALTDGLIMYDPNNNAVIYSRGGQWRKVSDDTVV